MIYEDHCDCCGLQFYFSGGATLRNTSKNGAQIVYVFAQQKP